jgi:predicted Zn-dependent protease
MIRPLILALLITGSARIWADTPVNHRVQEMHFSRAVVQAVAASAYHVKLSRLAARGELDSDPATLKRVRHISARLIAQAIQLKPEAAGWPWEVHLTSDDQVAAFSMAGGKLLVGSHFIRDYHLSDEELTVALAHEVAHVIAEHVREQVSRAAVLDPPAPNMTLSVSDVINNMGSDISLYMRLQPLFHLQELEADDIGIELAARAGVPEQSIKSFYAKITSEDTGQSIFDTHGSSHQREQFVRGMAPYAAITYAARHQASTPVYLFR